MTRYNVLIPSSVIYDIQEIVDYISEEYASIALAILDRLENKINSLKSYPDRGRVVPELLSQNIIEYHELIEAPWRIIYKIVDSNVFIYERILEELRNGISPQASIHAGYERAFTTIVDANVATLIVAMVLFSLGTGAVKSFAVVLTIGLMTSMLTAIVFTRAIVNLVYGFGRHTRKLSIGI